MNILIIESCEAKIERNFKQTSIVHVRNSMILRDYFDCDIISVENEIASVIDKKYDVIICMYASGYMMYNKYLEILIRNKNAKVFWMVNEYSVPDNILLRKWVQKCGIGYDMICNLARESYKQSHLNLTIRDRKLNDWIINWHTINLNCLIFDNSFVRKVKKDLFRQKKEDCVYYSTYRPDRIKDMLDYNGADCGISTSKKNILNFKKDGIFARYGRKLSWTKGRETLYNYRYSIYFEDTHTHTNYNHMANRFYECLMLDVLLFYDFRCLSTIEQSKYHVDNFLVVKNGAELTEKIDILNTNEAMYNELLNSQRSNIPVVLQEKQSVLERIKEILFANREVEYVAEMKEDLAVRKQTSTSKVTQLDLF